MGIWGPKIYENDIALDVKDEFEMLFDEGKSVQVITDILLTENKEIISEPKDAQHFWLALADVQYDKGVLLPMVKEMALHWIERGDLKLDYQIHIPMDIELRTLELKKLREKLHGGQPAVKDTKKRKLYKCPWNIGDVYAYQLDSDLAKERGLYGRYFLIQKVDEANWWPGHIVPIVYVKITKDENLPSSIEEYNQLEYVQTSFTKFENRFWPINMSRPEEDIAEKMKIKYVVDEYGFLPEYRIILINTSKKVIPSKLQYFGKFENVRPPHNEYVPHVTSNIKAVSWKRSEETFESKIINCYCWYNRRELGIYRK